MLYIILLNSSARMADLKSRVLRAVVFPFLSPQAKKSPAKATDWEGHIFYKDTKRLSWSNNFISGKKRMERKGRQQGHFNNITEYFLFS